MYGCCLCIDGHWSLELDREENDVCVGSEDAQRNLGPSETNFLDIDLKLTRINLNSQMYILLNLFETGFFIVL
jgi:hypothetical protein